MDGSTGYKCYVVAWFDSNKLTERLEADHGTFIRPSSLTVVQVLPRIRAQHGTKTHYTVMVPSVDTPRGLYRNDLAREFVVFAKLFQHISIPLPSKLQVTPRAV